MHPISDSFDKYNWDQVWFPYCQMTVDLSSLVEGIRRGTGGSCGLGGIVWINMDFLYFPFGVKLAQMMWILVDSHTLTPCTTVLLIHPLQPSQVTNVLIYLITGPFLFLSVCVFVFQFPLLPWLTPLQNKPTRVLYWNACGQACWFHLARGWMKFMCFQAWLPLLRQLTTWVGVGSVCEQISLMYSQWTGSLELILPTALWSVAHQEFSTSD